MFSTTEITSADISSDQPIHQRLFRAYVEAAQLVGGKVLELGVGVGRGLEVILPAAEHYVGVDKNQKLLNLLAQQHPKAEFICQHMPPLAGIESNQFDWIISFQVIEHIAKDGLFLQEIQRVLKPGGKAIISTPNLHRSLTRNPWHVREYRPEELEQLMQGFFGKVEARGIHANEKAEAYYEANRRAVERITRFDILKLQYRLPRQILQIPYDLLNRLNRQGLQKQNQSLVSDIQHEDYYLGSTADNCLDLFYIGEK